MPSLRHLQLFKNKIDLVAMLGQKENTKKPHTNQVRTVLTDMIASWGDCDIAS